MSADVPAQAYIIHGDAFRSAFGQHRLDRLSVDERRRIGDALAAALEATLPALTAATAAQAAAAERERWLTADDGTASVYHLGRHDERERIRQLAIEHEARYRVPDERGRMIWRRQFADLLGGTADGAHTPGGTA